MHGDLKVWLVTIGTLAFAWGPTFLAIGFGIFAGLRAVRYPNKGDKERPRSQSPKA